MFLPCPVRSLLPCPCTLPSAFTPRPRPCNVSLPLPLPLPLPLARQPGANINGVACYKPSRPPPDPRPPTPDHPLRSWNRVSDTRAFSSHPLAPSGRGHHPASLLPGQDTHHRSSENRKRNKKKKQRSQDTVLSAHRHHPRQSAPHRFPGRLHGRLPPDPRTPSPFPLLPIDSLAVPAPEGQLASFQSQEG